MIKKKKESLFEYYEAIKYGRGDQVHHKAFWALLYLITTYILFIHDSFFVQNTCISNQKFQFLSLIFIEREFIGMEIYTFIGESVTKRIQNYNTGTKTQREKYNFITVTCIQKFLLLKLLS